MTMRHILLTIIAILTSFVVNADIILADSTININTAGSRNMIDIENLNGVSWYGDSSNYIKIDLSHSGKTYVSGSKDCINFYDMDRNDYNVIFVEGTNIMSDSCAKTDIEQLENDLLMDLHPVAFKWKNEDAPTKLSAASRTSTEENSHYGFVAQEMMTILPEAVSVDDFGNYMVNYNAVIPVLIKALKALEEKIAVQNKEINDLITEIGFYMN